MLLKYLLSVAVLAAAAHVAAAQNADHGKIMGCYVGTWAFYRPGYGKFDIDDIDPNLCTHGFYGFADLDNQTWTIYAYDPWYDLAPDDCPPGYCNYDSYRRFVALKDQNPDFVPLLSIGGWNAGSGKYSMMAADPAKRKTFIDSVIPFVQKFGFDGVDLDWEYPAFREGTIPEEDKENFSLLVEEMSAALKAAGLYFAAALSPNPGIAADAYDIPFVSQYFDHMAVMTYDFHGYWDNHTYYTGHNSPLINREEENHEGHPGYLFDVFDSLNWYLDNGAPLDKLVSGIATYGRGWQLIEPDLYDGLYCPADDGIPMGPYTRQKGIWGYNEVLLAFTNDSLWNLPEGTPHAWEVVVDDCYKAPYTINGPYWLGYDDPESAAWKAKFANEKGIAGSMIWSMDTDDFSGMNSDAAYPILRSINSIFHSGEKFLPDRNCGSAPFCKYFDLSTTPTPSPTTTTTTTTSTTSPDLPATCREDNEIHPYPGDCHKYYRCDEQSDGSFDVQVFSCGDYIFNPNTDACVDPCQQGNDDLCPDEEFDC